MSDERIKEKDKIIRNKDGVEKGKKTDDKKPKNILWTCSSVVRAPYLCGGIRKCGGRWFESSQVQAYNF